MVPFEASEAEYIEKKSRFIGNVWHVEEESQAREYIAATAAKHHTASHGVYAYEIKSRNVSRFSDAGEPKGTAGLPVFDVFRKEEVSDFLCVVTRYFGGILLGAGGLVRAYSTTAKMALDAAGKAELRPYYEFYLMCEYDKYDIIRNMLKTREHEILSTEFATDVTMKLSLPKEFYTQVERETMDITRGGAMLYDCKELFKPRKI